MLKVADLGNAGIKLYFDVVKTKTKKRAGGRPVFCRKVGLNDWKLRKPRDLKKAFWFSCCCMT